MTTTTTTDTRGSLATVGRVAPCGAWPTTAIVASRHHLGTAKPMASGYQVQAINGFDRRPSEGST